jgi:hypothetical protein
MPGLTISAKTIMASASQLENLRATRIPAIMAPWEHATLFPAASRALPVSLRSTTGVAAAAPDAMNKRMMSQREGLQVT